MTIPRSICIALLLGFLILAGCVVVSTLVLIQCSADRQFVQQHCVCHT